MDAEKLVRLKAERFAFLRAMYDACDGNPSNSALKREIASDLGYDEALADKIAQYLINEGLLEWVSQGFVSVTHLGIVEVEAAIAAPETETEHFPALVIAENYIRVDSMVGSAVQQGTDQSTQIVMQPREADELRVFIDELRLALEAANLEPFDREAASSTLEILDAQLSSPEPKAAMVRNCLQSLRRITEGAAIAAAAPQLTELAEKLAHFIAAIG